MIQQTYLNYCFVYQFIRASKHFFREGGALSLLTKAQCLRIGKHLIIPCHSCRNQIAWRLLSRACCCTYCSYDSQSWGHWVRGAVTFTLVFDVLISKQGKGYGWTITFPPQVKMTLHFHCDVLNWGQNIYR